MQVLESYSELSAVQEMGSGIEVNNFSIPLIGGSRNAVLFSFFIGLLQLLSNFFFLSATSIVFFVQIELFLQAWLARTLQKLDSLLLGVCQMFNEESYVTVSIPICWK